MKVVVGLLLAAIVFASCNVIDGSTEYKHKKEDISGKFWDGGWGWGSVKITISGNSFHATYNPGSRLNPGAIDGTIRKCLYPANPQPEKIGWCVDARWADTASRNGHKMRSGTVTLWISDMDIDSIVGRIMDENGNFMAPAGLDRSR